MNIMEKKVGLFEDINSDIKSCECINVDERHEIHRYTMHDGTIYSVPSFKINSEYINDLIGKLAERKNHVYPVNVNDIESICESIVAYMELYVQLKEVYRFLSTTKKNNTESNDIISRVHSQLDIAQKNVAINSRNVANEVPVWFGLSSHGTFKYPGKNPRDEWSNQQHVWNIDRKYDCKLSGDLINYIPKRKDMYLSIATSWTPYIPSEDEIYGASELTNVNPPRRRRPINWLAPQDGVNTPQVTSQDDVNTSQVTPQNNSVTLPRRRRMVDLSALQNDANTSQVTPQNNSVTLPRRRRPINSLAPQDGVNTPQVTPQNNSVTLPRRRRPINWLAPQDDVNTSQVTSQDDTVAPQLKKVIRRQKNDSNS